MTLFSVAVAALALLFSSKFVIQFLWYVPRDSSALNYKRFMVVASDYLPRPQKWVAKFSLSASRLTVHIKASKTTTCAMEKRTIIPIIYTTISYFLNSENTPRPTSASRQPLWCSWRVWSYFCDLLFFNILDLVSPFSTAVCQLIASRKMILSPRRAELKCHISENRGWKRSRSDMLISLLFCSAAGQSFASDDKVSLYVSHDLMELKHETSHK